jgi:hypothetical protein
MNATTATTPAGTLYRSYFDTVIHSTACVELHAPSGRVRVAALMLTREGELRATIAELTELATEML